MKVIEEYESESTNLDQSIDMYELELREESAETLELETTTVGRRYLLRERRAPTTYVSQYILLIDESELDCYDEAMANKHKEKWLSAM